MQTYTEEFTILYQLGYNKKELIRFSFLQILIDLAISYVFSMLVGIVFFGFLAIISREYPFLQSSDYYQYLFTFSFHISDILIFGVISLFFLAVFCAIKLRMLIKTFEFSHNFSEDDSVKSDKNQNWRYIYLSLIFVMLLVLVIHKIISKGNPEHNSWNDSLLGLLFIVFLFCFSISIFFIGPRSYSFILGRILIKLETKKKGRKKRKEGSFKEWWNRNWLRNDSIKRFSYSNSNYKKILSVVSLVICLLSFSVSFSYSQVEYLERKSTFLQAGGHVISLYIPDTIPIENISDTFLELEDSKELFGFRNYSWKISLPTFSFVDPICDSNVYKQSVINFREWESEGILDDEWLENSTWDDILPKLDDPEYILCPDFLKTCGYQENQRIDIETSQNGTSVIKNLTIAGFYHVLPLIEYNAPYTPDQTYVQFHGGEIIYGQINDSDTYSIHSFNFVFHGISLNLTEFNQNITQFFESQFPSSDISFRYSEIVNRLWNNWVGYNSVEMEFQFLQYFQAISILTLVICIFLLFSFTKQHLLLNESTNVSYQLMGVSVSELREIERINASILILFALPWWIIGQILTFFVIETYNLANSPAMSEFSRMYFCNPLSIVVTLGFGFVFYLGYIIQTAVIIKKNKEKGNFQRILGKTPT